MKLFQYILMALGSISLLAILYFVAMYHISGWQDEQDEKKEQ